MTRLRATTTSAPAKIIGSATQMKILPVAVDPPLQRTFKRLVNAHFTPAKVTPWEAPTRVLVNESLMKLAGWIGQFIAARRADERGGAARRGDVVDAVLDAEIEGRPITMQEAIGTIHLLIVGGLETTAGVLGAAMMRFCEHPEILEQIRARPELIGAAVEELLRLDGSFICIGRTARHDTEIDGHQVKEGERVIMYGRRRTATRPSSTTQTPSTRPASGTGTSPSARDRTAASAPTSPG